MKLFSSLALLILFIFYKESTLKTIPDSIIIPKPKNIKNIPLLSFSDDDTNSNEPTLKVSPKIELPAKDFTLIENNIIIPTLYIDKKDSAYDGISLISEALKSDLARIIGEKVDKEGKASKSENGLQIVTSKSDLPEKVIIAGTFGEKGNQVINQLIEDGKVDVTELENRWESYLMQVVRRPLSGVNEALIIIGSDKRGTIYGLLHISEIIGISPWVWWADVLPEKKENVILPVRNVI